MPLRRYTACDRDAYRCRAERMGRAGSAFVVEVCRRGNTEIGIPSRGGVDPCNWDHLSDARARLSRSGRKAFETLGPELCLEHLLNSPGNFTASKLAWVKEHEPELFAQIDRFMLPGDYILYRLTGDLSTTRSGLSEQILWNFKEDRRADFVVSHYGIDPDTIPAEKPSIGVQAYVHAAAAAELGLAEGTPVTYRAGDQPNNAFSLNVLDPERLRLPGEPPEWSMA